VLRLGSPEAIASPRACLRPSSTAADQAQAPAAALALKGGIAGRRDHQGFFSAGWLRPTRESGASLVQPDASLRAQVAAAEKIALSTPSHGT